MNLKKEINTFIAMVFTVLLLAACGSDSPDSGNAPTNNTPPANTAPIAGSDIADVSNNNSVTINVLENDSDADGDTLVIQEISTDPANGSAVVDGDSIIYTPNDFYAGEDSFSYTLSDGTATATGDVSVSVVQEVTISGVVIDKPIPNARVTVAIGNEEFVTESDSEGNYSLAITLRNTDASAPARIHAVGSEENTQENVVLMSQTPNIYSMLIHSEESRDLSAEEFPSFNVTHVSTAKYLLALEKNNGETIGTVKKFDELSSSIGAQKLMDVAAFIKLLVDYDYYKIPVGDTLLTVLQKEELTIQQAIGKYLDENRLLDEDGNETAQYSADLAQALEETLSDPRFLDSFEVESLLTDTLIFTSGSTREGWLDFGTASMQLQEDGSGMFYDNFKTRFDGGEGDNISWEVADNSTLIIRASEESGVEFFWTLRITDLAKYGFSDAVIEQLQALVQDGDVEKYRQIGIKEYSPTRTYRVMSDSSTEKLLVMDEEISREIISIPGVTIEGENPKTTVTERAFQNLVTTSSISVSQADYIGKWALPLFYDFEPELEHYGDSRTAHDIMTLEENGTASATYFTSTFTWSFEDGAIEIINQQPTDDVPSEKFHITPIKQVGLEYLVQIKHFTGGIVENIYTSKMVKFDDSLTVASFTQKLQTELPHFVDTRINAHIESQWSGETYNLDSIFGYKFNKDGSLIRAIMAYDRGDFNGDNDWTWQQSEKSVNFSFSRKTPYYTRNRTWIPVAMDENGRMHIVEFELTALDNNQDGVITDDELLVRIQPRLNILVIEDLSQWPGLLQYVTELLTP